MKDKDMTERSVLAEVFVDATLQLCLFHTLRSFKREFSMEKMGLRAGMRDTVLEILAGTTHANSPTVFDKKYAMLKDLQLQPVVEFFNKNWQGIKHEWATCYKNGHFTLGGLTNNWLGIKHEWATCYKNGHFTLGGLTNNWLGIKHEWATCYKNDHVTLDQPSGEHEWEDQEYVFSICDFGHLLHGVLCGVACVER